MKFDVSLMVRLVLGVLERKITGIISRVHTIKVTYHIDIDFDHLLEVVFVSFLHCKVTLPYPPLLSILYSLGGSLFA